MPFMPKYQSLPFLVLFMSGPRLPALFFVGLGTSMIVASTRLPERRVSRILEPIQTRRAVGRNFQHKGAAMFPKASFGKAAPLPLEIDRNLPKQLQLQIFRTIQRLITDGLFKSRRILPSFREMAAQLDTSKNTVILAYERLICEGYLATRPGIGTFVHPICPNRACSFPSTSPSHTKRTIRRPATISQYRDPVVLWDLREAIAPLSDQDMRPYPGGSLPSRGPEPARQTRPQLAVAFWRPRW